jgi:hypothetical protein
MAILREEKRTKDIINEEERMENFLHPGRFHSTLSRAGIREFWAQDTKKEYLQVHGGNVSKRDPVWKKIIILEREATANYDKEFKNLARKKRLVRRNLEKFRLEHADVLLDLDLH